MAVVYSFTPLSQALHIPTSPDAAVSAAAMVPPITAPAPVSEVIMPASPETPAPTTYAFWRAVAAQLSSNTAGGKLWTPFFPLQDASKFSTVGASWSGLS